VDTGDIVAVKRFPVSKSDTVESLLRKTYLHQYGLFVDIMEALQSANSLPRADEYWARNPYTRKEFNDLMTVQCHMDAEEIKKRIRATSFGRWQPSIVLHGYRFEYKA